MNAPSEAVDHLVHFEGHGLFAKALQKLMGHKVQHARDRDAHLDLDRVLDS